MRTTKNLHADHKEAEGVLTKFGVSEPGLEWNSTCEKVSEVLLLHMHIEDAHAHRRSHRYPLVEELEGKDIRHEADVEHGLALDGNAQDGCRAWVRVRRRVVARRSPPFMSGRRKTRFFLS